MKTPPTIIGDFPSNSWFNNSPQTFLDSLNDVLNPAYVLYFFLYHIFVVYTVTYILLSTQVPSERTMEILMLDGP